MSNDNSSKLKGTIRHIENLGEHLLCYINLEKNNEITAKLDVNSRIKINEIIHLDWHKNHQHFLILWCFNRLKMSKSPELGVCYYPEHWPEEMWITDAENMTKMVSVG